MLRKLASAFAFLLTLTVSVVSAQAACSVPNTLTNGTTADATAVMGNFTSIVGCAAPLASPSFTGSVGIGMTASNILDVTQNQNAMSTISVLNNSSGASARLAFQLNNGTSGGYLVQNGASFTASGLDRADGMKLINTGGGGLTLATSVAQPIYFGISNAEVARITPSSTSFLVGKTANGLAFPGFQANYSTGQTDVTVSGSEAMNIVRTSTTGNLVRFFATDAVTVIGSIANNANTSTQYNTTSDERLKDWQVSQHDYRPVIEQLWVGDFRWKKTGAPDFGYRAQQAYALFPEAVHKPSDSKGVWVMDYGKTAALAMWGVKDLYKGSVRQAQEIAALQKEVKTLKAQLVTYQQVRASEINRTERLEAAVLILQRGVGIRTAQN